MRWRLRGPQVAQKRFESISEKEATVTKLSKHRKNLCHSHKPADKLESRPSAGCRKSRKKSAPH